MTATPLTDELYVPHHRDRKLRPCDAKRRDRYISGDDCAGGLALFQETPSRACAITLTRHSVTI